MLLALLASFTSDYCLSGICSCQGCCCCFPYLLKALSRQNLTAWMHKVQFIWEHSDLHINPARCILPERQNYWITWVYCRTICKAQVKVGWYIPQSSDSLHMLSPRNKCGELTDTWQNKYGCHEIVNLIIRFQIK